MHCFHRVLLACSLLLVAPRALAAVVYVSDDGTGDGMTASNPIGSLAQDCPDGNTKASCKAGNSSLYRGLRQLLKLGGGTLVLVGKVQIDERHSHGAVNTDSHDFIMPEHRYSSVTITGSYNGMDYGKQGAALIIKTPAHVSLNGLTVLQHLTIRTVGDYRAIVCNSAHCVFGEGITVLNEQGQVPTDNTLSSALTVVGGERYSGGKSTKEGFSIKDRHLKISQIEVYSGVYRRIVGGIFGYDADVCDDKQSLWVQQGDAYVKIGGNTVVLESVRVGSNRCSSALLGDSHLWITGGSFHGTIEGVGYGGFLTSDSRTWMRIDGGDFTKCSGIYGGSAKGVRRFQPKESVLDISRFDSTQLESSGLLKAVVRSRGYYGSGVLQVHDDPSAPLDASRVLFYSRESIDVDKYRQVIVDYMVSQAALRWTPSETYYANIHFKTDPTDENKLQYLNPGGVWLKQQKGDRIAGIPYESKRRTSFEEMKFFCRGNTDGMCTYQVPLQNLTTWQDGNPRTDPVSRSFMGATCSSSVYNAWEKQLNGFDIDSVSGSVLMMPIQQRGIVKVGDYTIDPDKGKKYASSILLWKTKQICADSGRETMYAAYAKLLPGDAVVWTTPEKGTGHVRMVRKSPIINTSDMGASTIEFVEQTNGFFRNESDKSFTGWVAEDDVRPKSGVGNVPNVHTFKQLFEFVPSGDQDGNGCYIPVTHADLQNGVRELPTVRTAAPETAASLMAIRDNPTGNENLFSSTVLSNYRIYGGRMMLSRYEQNGDKKVVASYNRFYWETLNKWKLASGFYYRMIPLGAIGYDDVSYYNYIVKSLRGQVTNAEANVIDGRWSFSFDVMVGEHDNLQVQQVDFIVGDGPYRKVIYDANGAQYGTVPKDSTWYAPGQSAKVLENTGNLKLNGFVFDGWNTMPLAHGSHYQPGADLMLGKDDTRLYVQWKPVLHDAGTTGDANADAQRDATGQDAGIVDGVADGTDGDAGSEDADADGCGCELAMHGGDRGSAFAIAWWRLLILGVVVVVVWRRRLSASH